MKYALLFFSFLFIFILNVDSASAQATAAACSSSGGVPQYRKQSDGSKVYSSCIKDQRPANDFAGTKVESLNEKCQRQLSAMGGGKGCYSSRGGSCSFGFDKCTTPSLCSSNGGKWEGKSCVDKNSVAQSPTNPCACTSATPEMDFDSEYACVKTVDGQRVAKSKTASCDEFVASTAADAKKAACEKAGGDFDGSSKNCKCEAMQATLAYNSTTNSFPKCTPRSGSVANFLKICADAGGGGEEYAMEGGGARQICTCEANGAEIDPTKQKCPAVASKPGDVPSCLKDFKAKAEACKADGIKAVNSCNKDNKDANAQWSAAQSVIGPMAQIMQMRGQQQGSAETCFQAGALATTTYGAMDLLKESCDQEIEVCQFKCHEAEEAYKEIEKKCESEAVGKPEGYLAKMKQEADKINADLEKGAAACETDAKTNQARIIDMMNGMNKSAQQAAKCQCQLTAGQTNCDQILGPADCKLTPKDPRCPQVVTVKCAGTDYNTKECICLRDPKATSCIGTTGSGASQVAGFNPVGAGSTNFKMGGTGSGGGLGDFPSDTAAAVSMDKTQGGVDSPFGVAGSGGGGGSSGGGGSDGGGTEGGAAEPEAKTGIAGLFNNLKTGVAGLFGGSSKKPTTADGKNFGGKTGASKNVDPNQWRPVGLRGIAGGNGIGSKNSDIFKTVNNQYNNQYHTLMTLPAEGPK